MRLLERLGFAVLCDLGGGDRRTGGGGGGYAPLEGCGDDCDG